MAFVDDVLEAEVRTGKIKIHSDADFEGMRREAPTERARQAQRLVIGPWAHWTPMLPVVGDVDFGPEAVLDTTAMRLAWFGHFLHDGPQPAMAPVRRDDRSKRPNSGWFSMAMNIVGTP